MAVRCIGYRVADLPTVHNVKVSPVIVWRSCNVSVTVWQYLPTVHNVKVSPVIRKEPQRFVGVYHVATVRPVRISCIPFILSLQIYNLSTVSICIRFFGAT
jgi:hypothetical protein